MSEILKEYRILIRDKGWWDSQISTYTDAYQAAMRLSEEYRCPCIIFKSMQVVNPAPRKFYVCETEMKAFKTLEEALRFTGMSRSQSDVIQCTEDPSLTTEADARAEDQP